MKKNLTRQEGLTLVEVLAALTILSFLIILLWGVLINSFNHSNKSQNSVSLQHEANLIITELTTIHQNNKSYTIHFDEPLLKVDTPDGTTKNIGSSGFRYRFYNTSTTPEKLLTTSIDVSGDFSFRLVIQSTQNLESTYEIRSTLSRLVGDN